MESQVEIKARDAMDLKKKPQGILVNKTEKKSEMKLLFKEKVIADQEIKKFSDKMFIKKAVKTKSRERSKVESKLAKQATLKDLSTSYQINKFSYS